MAKKKYEIVGRVVSAGYPSRGVPYARVEAYDKDLLVDDLVGSAVTGTDGSFRMEFDTSYFRELFFDRKPDLFFKVYYEDELIKSTEDSVLWNIEAGTTEVVIEVSVATGWKGDAYMPKGPGRGDKGGGRYGGPKYGGPRYGKSGGKYGGTRGVIKEDRGVTRGGGVRESEVTCSVFSPILAAPGDEILIQAYAHLPGQEQWVASMAARADPTGSYRASQALTEPVATGASLGFHLRMRGVEIDEPDIVLVWRDAPLVASFGVYIPEDCQTPRGVNATVRVTKDGVPIGHIKFTLQVLSREQKQHTAVASSRELLGTLSRYREAFISYASDDRLRVTQSAQVLSAAKIKVFQDILNIDPGDRWKNELYRHIDRCDVFFLFWSKAAGASEWVRKEVLYAHTRRRGMHDAPPEIIPIIIEGPPPVEPPAELNFLQFNDKFLYLLAGVEAEAEARSEEAHTQKP